MTDKTNDAPPAIAFRAAKINVEQSLNRLKTLRKAAQLVRDSGDDMFLYAANSLAHECIDFVNLVSALNEASEKRAPGS